MPAADSSLAGCNPIVVQDSLSTVLSVLGLAEDHRESPPSASHNAAVRLKRGNKSSAELTIQAPWLLVPL